MCDSEGNTPVKVTSFEGPLVASPVWSPDGKQISFYGAAEGNSDIYVVPSTGGAPRRLTSDLSSDASPSWSGDGEWIYFESLRTGEMEVWKIRVGGSEVVQVTTGGGDNPFESPDGSTLFFAKRKDGLRLWKMPVKGGKEQEVTDSLFSINLFTVVEQGVYFIPGPSSEDGFWIHFLDFSTGEAIPVVPVAKDRDKTQNSRLSVSADGQYILFTLKENESDLMLVENFR